MPTGPRSQTPRPSAKECNQGAEGKSREREEKIENGRKGNYCKKKKLDEERRPEWRFTLYAPPPRRFTHPHQRQQVRSEAAATVAVPEVPVLAPRWATAAAEEAAGADGAHARARGLAVAPVLVPALLLALVRLQVPM